MTIIDLMSLASLISSIASLVLAVVAIALSVKFFQMTDKSSRSVENAAKDIDNSVNSLSAVFNRMYSDLFTMMQSSYKDMTDFILKSDKDAGGESQSVNISAQDFKKILEPVIEDVIGKGEKDAEKISTKIYSAIDKSKKEERAENENKIIDYIRNMQGLTTVEMLSKYLDVSYRELSLNYLFSLREKDLITWAGNANRLSRDTELVLND